MKVSASFDQKAQAVFPGIDKGKTLEGIDVSTRVRIDATFQPGKALFSTINVSRFTGEMMGKMGLINEADSQSKSKLAKLGLMSNAVVSLTSSHLNLGTFNDCCSKQNLSASIESLDEMQLQ